MLSEINLVGNWFKNDLESGWFFDEIFFNDEAKLAFSELELDIKIFEHSARVDVANNKNHCYIPSHYFLYALKIQPFVSLLSDYMVVFNQVKNSVPTAVDFHNLINNSSTSNSVLTALDQYSRDNFLNAFRSKNYRLGGKDIINDDKIKGKKYRSQDDFMTSILLKALPVPDASSGVLGDLLYAFSKSPSAYKVLMDNYSATVPYMFRAGRGDELIFMILSTLGWQGLLDPTLGAVSGRYSNWGVIDKAFLFSPTPVPGNTQYVEEPIHHSPSLNQYVHIKKGLLNTDELIATVSELISGLWKNMSIQKDDGVFFFRSSRRFISSGPVFEGATNKIFYGAPGTGKSHKIHTEECKGAEKIVTVFHPDTQHNDFVGALKPKMELGSDGKPVVTYQFRPGPFTNALVKAKSYPDKHICLVIEEINRAPAAAVFGELFQLLDRDENGQSTYKIDSSDPDMLMYINEQLRLVGSPELLQLEVPSNLSILATMNSSDQTVMPMDTAFKRRWSFQYIDIDFDNDAVPSSDVRLATENGLYDVSWPALAQIVNDVLIDCHVAEDRLLGPFFITLDEMKDPQTAKDTLNGKLFVYLWDDVLRHLGHTKIFSSKYKTFGKLSSAFNKNMAVFNSFIEERIEKEGRKIEVAEAPENAVE
ncbi:AAA family ATPase [Vibrio penaeicida]|uniref:McrB family protein n=1 Tax=Vibrio penaeicida TaxID=104609 RepID=UPI0027362064|nr:AAA family ATPase [Vibrio penaeicida]MDP2572473.1 AAA family ATPase [Vibrio penaeicida]